MTDADRAKILEHTSPEFQAAVYQDQARQMAERQRQAETAERQDASMVTLFVWGFRLFLLVFWSLVAWGIVSAVRWMWEHPL